jgi:hypothetical protein
LSFFAFPKTSCFFHCSVCCPIFASCSVLCCFPHFSLFFFNFSCFSSYFCYLFFILSTICPQHFRFFFSSCSLFFLLKFFSAILLPYLPIISLYVSLLPLLLKQNCFFGYFTFPLLIFLISILPVVPQASTPSPPLLSPISHLPCSATIFLLLLFCNSGRPRWPANRDPSSLFPSSGGVIVLRGAVLSLGRES